MTLHKRKIRIIYSYDIVMTMMVPVAVVVVAAGEGREAAGLLALLLAVY